MTDLISFSFDAGVENVSLRQDPAPVNSLPAAFLPLPTSQRFELQLEDLLYPLSPEQQMLKGLRPSADAGLLSPATFRSMPSAVRAKLVELAHRDSGRHGANDDSESDDWESENEKRASSGPADSHGRSNRTRNELLRASRVLEEFEQLDDLARHYLFALLQG